MKTWEDVRQQGLAEAHTLLASVERMGIDLAFSEWWSQELEGGKPEIQPSRADTARIVEQLRKTALTDIADFIGTTWVKEGPVHPGVWGFVVLLGESFVPVFLAALMRNEWISPRFYGLDAFGAWEAFETLLRERLRGDALARESALSYLRLWVEEIKQNSDKAFAFYGRQTQTVQQDIARFMANPCIDVAWDSPLDGYAYVDCAFLFLALIVARCEHVLRLLADMPHPALVKAVLRPNTNWMYPDILTFAITMSPETFDDSGKFESGGSVIISVLDCVDAAIRATVHDKHGNICVVSSDSRHELDKNLDKMQSLTTQYLEAFFARKDATTLGWAWLETVIHTGNAPGRLPVTPEMKKWVCLDARMYLVGELSRRLLPRNDWELWIRAANGPRRVYRAIAASLVKYHSQSSDPQILGAILESMFAEEICYPSIGLVMPDRRDLLARLAAQVICALTDPPVWIWCSWERLRPLRERGWRSYSSKQTGNNSAELLVLFSVAAMELTDDGDLQIRLWHTAEVLVRDALQTEMITHAGTFWSNALVRVFSRFRPLDAAEYFSDKSELSSALVPYISPDRRFMDIVVTLLDHKWLISDISNACARWGFNLKNLIDQYLAMTNQYRTWKGFDTQHILRLADVSELLT